MSKLSDYLTARAAELNISQTTLAETVGMSQPSISDLFNGLTASPRKWREIADALQTPHEKMRDLMIEAGREGGKPTRLPRSVTRLPIDELTRRDLYEPNATIDTGVKIPAASRYGRMLPVLGEAVGGSDGEYTFNGQVLDYVACPPSLANVLNAYAVWIDGESMYPRFRAGELAYVHPGLPARRGDDVIVQIRPREEDMPPRGFVKEMIGWASDQLVLHQFNPESQLKFPREIVVSVHPIVLSGKY
ncbi:UNVERIFIED_ORG: phage repressor protein C with HTH and peptisase S24 domain [Rhizobium esperanzae]